MSEIKKIIDKSKQNLCREWASAYETIEELYGHLAEEEWKRVQITAMGAYLGDIYKAVEHSLRTLIEEIDGKKAEKNEFWHKNLLERGFELDLIPIEAYKTIREMLNFRHVFIHSYAITLDAEIIKKDVPEVINAFSRFVHYIGQKFEIFDADIDAIRETRKKNKELNV
jgi:uncharacterized protein YutE (UPF0331/DUF86 family)